MSARKRILFIALFVVFALACYFYFALHRNKNPHVITHEIGLIKEDVSPTRSFPLTDQKKTMDHDRKTMDVETVPAEAKKTVATGENLCAVTEKQVRDYFHYLDTKDYVKRLCKGSGIEQKYNEIVRKLSQHPPVPAGEGLNPGTMISNVFHFFRVLSVDDIRLLKEIVSREHDSIEVVCQTLYKWMMADNCNAHAFLIRPDRKTIYKYAGFFVNTTGGRAYLTRRSDRLRLLVNYYCILALNDADKRGLNEWGIDIAPFVSVLEGEIKRYPDLVYQDQYLKTLGRIESYYMIR